MKLKFAHSFDHSSRMKSFCRLNQTSNSQQIAKSLTTLQTRNQANDQTANKNQANDQNQ